MLGYDDWIGQYCVHAPNRLAGVGIAVPVLGTRVPAAGREVVRAKELGLVGMMVRPNFIFGRNLGDRHSSIRCTTRSRRTISCLRCTKASACSRAPRSAPTASPASPRAILCSHPMEQMAAMASLMLDGALNGTHSYASPSSSRAPAGSPIGSARLDDHIEWMHDTETKDLSLSATEYFARQCHHLV